MAKAIEAYMPTSAELPNPQALFALTKCVCRQIIKGCSDATRLTPKMIGGDKALKLRRLQLIFQASRQEWFIIRRKRLLEAAAIRFLFAARIKRTDLKARIV
jgi:hypothetical protein